MSSNYTSVEMEKSGKVAGITARINRNNLHNITVSNEDVTGNNSENSLNLINKASLYALM